MIFPRLRQGAWRYFCCSLLVCGGALGVLFSPAVGLEGGRETARLTRNHVTEHPWGTVVAVSHLDLPLVQTGRGLAFMSVFMAGSLGTFYAGIFGFVAERERRRVSGG